MKLSQQESANALKKCRYIIEKKKTVVLVTSFIILPVTACFQSLRSCSFGDCLLMGNCYHKDLWGKKINKQTQYSQNLQLS